MRHCPNPDCSSLRTLGVVAEYSDHVDQCADCGGALTDGAAPRPESPAPAPAASAALWGRAVVSAACAGIALALTTIVLPGLDLESIGALTAGSGHVGEISLGAIGLLPVVLAFVLVEIVALAVPRWRPLRITGAAGRDRLKLAVLVTALLFAGLQAYGIGLFVDSLVWYGIPVAANAALVITVSLVGATGLYVALTWVVDRHGLGNGFSVILGAEAAAYFVVHTGQATWNAVAGGFLSLGALAFLVAGLLGVAWMTGRLVTGRHPGPRSLCLPACGTAPLLDTVALAALPVTLGSLGVDTRWAEHLLVEPGRFDARTVALIAGLALLWSWLFNRPGRVAAVAGVGLAEAKRRVWRAALWSVAFLLVAAGVSSLSAAIGDAGIFAPVFEAMLLAAIATDLHAEWCFRREHGDATSAGRVDRTYALEPVLDSLRTAGVPSLAQSRGHRALLHFFGPHIGVELLVPASRAEVAGGIIQKRLDRPATARSARRANWPGLAIASILIMGGMYALADDPFPDDRRHEEMLMETTEPSLAERSDAAVPAAPPAFTYLPPRALRFDADIAARAPLALADLASVLSEGGVSDPVTTVRVGANELPAVSVTGETALEVWTRLRALVDRTGRYPVIVDGAAVEAVGAWVIQGRANALDVDRWVEAQLQRSGVPVPRGEWPRWESSSDPVIVSVATPGTWAPQTALDILLLPTVQSPDAAAWIATLAGANYGLAPEHHVAMARRLKQRYGAEIVFIGQGVIEYRVARPPTTQEAALEAARLRLAYCRDQLTRPDDTLEVIAAITQGAWTWYFWWD